MTTLNLGAGNDILAGAINHDLRKHRSDIDIVWDLNDLPWPWNDNSFDQIRAIDVFEHLDICLVEVMNECWRILTSDGTLTVKYPLYTSPIVHEDPTHRWFWGPKTFDYFDHGTDYGNRYRFYTPYRWEITERRPIGDGRSVIVKLKPRRYGYTMEQFEKDLEYVKANSPWNVIELKHCDIGDHPENYVNYEQAFAAEMIYVKSPMEILDIGSNRHFVLGLLAAYDVTTVDVRGRRVGAINESIVTCDAKSLDIPDDSFELVLSLHSVEHFGLGRYGDDVDLDADAKAVEEMIRVLKPGGWLVLSTTIHRSEPIIYFNAHRIYNRACITNWFVDTCELVQERFYTDSPRGFTSHDNVTHQPHLWDVYCGCWEKSR